MNYIENIEKYLLNFKEKEILAIFGVKGSHNRFTLNGGHCALFVGKEDNYLITNFSSGETLPLSRVLKEFFGIKTDTELLKIIDSENYSKTNFLEKSTFDKNLNKKKLLETIESSILETPPKFDHLGVEQLKEDYENLIGKVLFHANSKPLESLKIGDNGELVEFKNNFINREILLISNHISENKNINIRFKSQNGWRTVAGGSNCGFFFKRESPNLLVCEGGKDGINAHLCCSWDIFAMDSKYVVPQQLLEILPHYKKIVFAMDRDCEIEKLAKKIPLEKISFLDWKKIPIDGKNADITDLIKHLFETKTKRDFNRGALTSYIIKNCIKKRDITANWWLELYKKKFLEAKEKKQLQKIKMLYLRIHQKLTKYPELEGVFNQIGYFLLANRTTFANVQKAKIKKYLNEIKEEILAFAESNKKSIISAPAGSGKSTLIRELAKTKQLLILTPLKSLVTEFDTQEIKVIEYQTKIEHIQADWIGFIEDKKSICMTSDRFVINFNIFKEELDQFDFIVFDEQHLIEQSVGFRHLVVECEKKIEPYKTIYLSGTPLPKKHSNLLEVERVEKTNINYQITAESITDIIKNQNIQIGESSLIYCNTKATTIELVEVLQKEFLDVQIVRITSTSTTKYTYAIEWKKETTELESILTNNTKTIFVATSKIATGVNLPNLKHIVEYGATYTPENTIQLHNRLREDGSVTVANIKNNYIYQNDKESFVIGIFNAIWHECKKNNLNNLSKLFDKYPQSVETIKQKGNLETLDLIEFERKFRTELVDLAYYGLLSVKKNYVEKKWVIQDIQINHNNVQGIKSTFRKINIQKGVDFLLGELAKVDICRFAQYYNTSQNYIIQDITTQSKTKDKTLERKELEKSQRNEKAKKQDELFCQYVEKFDFRDILMEKLEKLSKRVDHNELSAFFRVEIEENRCLFLQKHSLIRNGVEFKVFIQFRLNLHKKVLEIIDELEQNYKYAVTIKELTNLYTESGDKIRAFKGDTNPFKSSIEYLVNTEAFMSLRGWKLSNSLKRIFGERYRNFIYKDFGKRENQLINYLTKNSVTNIQNFCHFAKKHPNQLAELREEALNRVIEAYLDEYKN